MEQKDLDRQAAAILRKFDPRKTRGARTMRPFMIEFFGTPKAGKSTIIGMLEHYFKRKGWTVSTPTEGAEVIELPRDEPQYNFQTGEYALSKARELAYSTRFHIGIFDRAIYDVLARMRYYVMKGVITPEQLETVTNYYLLPWNAGLFDAHICLVCDPEVAIKRELARALTSEDGQTMNPKTLEALLAAHEDLWAQWGSGEPNMYWHDSSAEDQGQTARNILEFVLGRLEAKLANSSK